MAASRFSLVCQCQLTAKANGIKRLCPTPQRNSNYYRRINSNVSTSTRKQQQLHETSSRQVRQATGG